MLGVLQSGWCFPPFTSEKSEAQWGHILPTATHHHYEPGNVGFFTGIVPMRLTNGRGGHITPFYRLCDLPRATKFRL